MIEKRPSVPERTEPMPDDWGIFHLNSFSQTTIKRCSRCANCGTKEDKFNKVFVDWHHIIPRAIAWKFGYSEVATGSEQNCIGLCRKPECHQLFNHYAYTEGKTFQEVLLEQGRHADLIRFGAPEGDITGRRFKFF